MELNKIDLRAIAAVGHEDEHLGLLIERGNQREYLEIPAPVEAYEGLQELNTLVNYQPFSPLANGTYRFEETITWSADDGLTYQYQKSVEVKVAEKLSVIEPTPAVYLTSLDYQPDSQSLTMAFDDGSIYQYEGVEPEFWQEFQQKIALDNQQAGL